METMAITQYVDVAQLVLYLFWIFFFGLVYYLVQEGHRDGYPLDSGRTPPVKMDGWPPIPSPKTYLLANGDEVVMPYPLQPPEFLQATPRHRFFGAPIEPTGNPLLAGVGPGSWANRADVPDHTPEGEAKIVPLRTQPEYGVATQDNDPRGLLVVGDDDEVAGTVSELWMDRSEAILNGEAPLSPSGINDDLGALQVYGLMANGRYAQIAATPSRAMTLAEIEETIADYAKGAANAIKAGCDGVEIHAANGYLPHQFLSATLNQRTDKYGGNLEGRMQFLKEVIEAILAKVDASKVGIRISPFAGYNNTRDPNAKETFTAVAKMVESYGLVYLHVADTNAWGGTPDMPEILKTVRPHYTGCLMGNGGIDPVDAQKMVEEGALDMVAFGRPFIANPDLPARIKNGGPYNEARYVGWYGGSEEGYTDYPAL